MNNLSVGQVADRFGLPPWKISRLFELRALPEPGSFAGRRVIPESWLGKIEAELIARGWIENAAAKK